MKPYDLPKLLSLLENKSGSIEQDNRERIDDLVSLLNLPEFREDNNPDLPFRLTGQYRGNTWRDSIRTIRMEHLRYGYESAFLAEWMGRLTGNPTVHCFSRSLTIEYDLAEEGLLQLLITRKDGKNTLHIFYDGPHRKGNSVEIWERGELLRRVDVFSGGGQIPSLVLDGIAVAVRHGASDQGIEILLAEGELGVREWKALVGCLCLQGNLLGAIDLLKDPIVETSVFPSLLSRFRAFLQGVLAVTKADGYVLRPLPVVRAQETPCDITNLLEEVPPQYRKSWEKGWRYLAHREFGSAAFAFSSCQEHDQSKWTLPLEERLVTHLESLSNTDLSTKESVELSAQFWKGVFQDLSFSSIA